VRMHCITWCALCQTHLPPPAPLVQRYFAFATGMRCNHHDVFRSHTGSCDNYVNVTEPSRNVAFASSSFSGYPRDDGHLSSQWSRFTGIGGDRIVEGCHSAPRGGFQYPTRFSFGYPTEESATAYTGTGYIHSGSCDSSSFVVDVVFCPGEFYILKPRSHPVSTSGFITCKIVQTFNDSRHRCVHFLCLIIDCQRCQPLHRCVRATCQMSLD
uniref:Uncharacterized protein n=1 Tax=Hippocampus comes TaxID=109280 RepID=A0A3Q2YMV7_HIPCM